MPLNNREIRDLAIRALEEEIKTIISNFHYDILSKNISPTKDKIIEMCDAIKSIDIKIEALKK